MTTAIILLLISVVALSMWFAIRKKRTANKETQSQILEPTPISIPKTEPLTRGFKHIRKLRGNSKLSN